MYIQIAPNLHHHKLNLGLKKELVPDRVLPRSRIMIFFSPFSIDFNSILALLLIGILFLVTQGGAGGLFGGGSASGYGNRNSYDYDNYYYNEQQFYKRSGYDNGMYTILLGERLYGKFHLVNRATFSMWKMFRRNCKI
jgi:hypothetical protein